MDKEVDFLRKITKNIIVSSGNSYGYKLEQIDSVCNQLEKKNKVLEQFKILKDWYPPFKEFLQQMFDSGRNTDLNALKEWLEIE